MIGIKIVVQKIRRHIFYRAIKLNDKQITGHLQNYLLCYLMLLEDLSFIDHNSFWNQMLKTKVTKLIKKLIWIITYLSINVQGKWSSENMFNLFNLRC